MKKTAVVIILLCLPLSFANAFDLQSFCRQDLTRKNCLQSFLQFKCSTYSGFRFALRRDWACEEAVALFVRQLDVGSAPLSSGANFSEEVIYKKELVALIREPKTETYLEALRNQLESAVQSGQTFRLWDQTLNLSSDRDTALKRLAIFFQDASSDPSDSESSSAHIRYLKQQPVAKTHLKVIELLDEVGTYFSPQALARFPQLKVYPAGYENVLNPTFYHFYVIIYASEKLLKSGQSREMSFFIPFLFNSQYEFKGMSGWPLLDPPGSEAENKWKSRELYSGYLASLSGVGEAQGAMSLAQFTKKLAASPYELLRSQFFIEFKKVRPE